MGERGAQRGDVVVLWRDGFETWQRVMRHKAGGTAWLPWGLVGLVERLGPLLGPALVARLAEERKALESSERYWLTPWVIGGAHIWDALYPAERAAIAWAIEAWKAEGPFE